MLLLPAFNATLQPCPVGPAAFTPHPQGHFCGQCQRVVQDFSRSQNPVADLAAARAAAPDGRVCGRFRAAQVARPRLTQRLKWFLVALVLVVGQGLTAPEALAQVHRTAPVRRPVSRHAGIKKSAKPVSVPLDGPDPEMIIQGGVQPSYEIEEHMRAPAAAALADTAGYTTSPEVFPSFQGAGLQAVAAYIQQHIRWPAGSERPDAEGRVFVSFRVDTLGRVYDVQLLKGIHPLLDAEALRVVRALPNFTPGNRGGRPIDMSLAVPVTFRRE